MTDMPPAIPSPLHEAASQIGRQAAANFRKKFGHGIIVEASRVELPGGGSDMAFRFRAEKPGLLPTALERDWFQGFIAGYRTACNVLTFLLDTPDDVTPS